jgi:hypothetical protein
MVLWIRLIRPKSKEGNSRREMRLFGLQTTASKNQALISFCLFRAGQLLNLLPAVDFFGVFFANHDLFADHVAWLILLSELKMFKI